MNNFKNFAPYTPGEDKRELVDAGVLFLLDENGNDWYECQKLFSECTKVIAYDSNNIVVSITDDASTLWPIGLSVAEVDSLPEDVDINGGWVFRDNSVVKRIYSDICILHTLPFFLLTLAFFYNLHSRSLHSKFTPLLMQGKQIH